MKITIGKHEFTEKEAREVYEELRDLYEGRELISPMALAEMCRQAVDPPWETNDS